MFPIFFFFFSGESREYRLPKNSNVFRIRCDAISPVNVACRVRRRAATITLRLFSLVILLAGCLTRRLARKSMWEWVPEPSERTYVSANRRDWPLPYERPGAPIGPDRRTAPTTDILSKYFPPMYCTLENFRGYQGHWNSHWTNDKIALKKIYPFWVRIL